MLDSVWPVQMIVNASVMCLHSRYTVVNARKSPEFQNIVPMSECPFCKINITEELTLYGGHCPGCLILIPGEETATDPGVELEASSDQGMKAAGGGFPTLALAVGLLFGFGVGGWWWVTQRAEPVATAPDMANGLVPAPISAHEDQVYKRSSSADEPEAEVPSTQPRSVVTKRVDTRTQAPERSGPVQDAAVLPTNSSAGLGSAPRDLFSTIGAAPKARTQKSIVLKDSLKVEEMVGRVLNRGAKQLEHCYTKALKMDEGLKGAWYVDFTISTDGKPIAVSVEALGAANGGIESCIHQQVERWRFQRIVEPVDVARTYRFGS